MTNNHTASLEITVNVHESVLSRKLVFWTSNWKHVIKYDLYVTFPRIFAHNVQICAQFCCKISIIYAKYVEYYTIILRGGVFCGHAVDTTATKQGSWDSTLCPVTAQSGKCTCSPWMLQRQTLCNAFTAPAMDECIHHHEKWQVSWWMQISTKWEIYHEDNQAMATGNM